MYRLKSYGVKSTILFFGSARAKSREQYDARLEELSKQVWYIRVGASVLVVGGGVTG